MKKLKGKIVNIRYAYKLVGKNNSNVNQYSELLAHKNTSSPF